MAQHGSDLPADLTGQKARNQRNAAAQLQTAHSPCGKGDGHWQMRLSTAVERKTLMQLIFRQRRDGDRPGGRPLAGAARRDVWSNS
jgi:hypothetical protein